MPKNETQLRIPSNSQTATQLCSTLQDYLPNKYVMFNNQTNPIICSYASTHVCVCMYLSFRCCFNGTHERHFWTIYMPASYLAIIYYYYNNK